MKRCLSEKSLVLLHSGEGSASDRAHLEGCLSCTRRYRQLCSDLGEIVAALKQPAPALRPRRRFTYSVLRWPELGWSGLGWSLAAAVIVLAFVCGRITSRSVADRGLAGPAESMEADSAEQADPFIQTAMANGPAINTPGYYGLYIDDLMTQDEPDQNLAVVDEADSDEP